jgi:hypothetical protein
MRVNRFSSDIMHYFYLFQWKVGFKLRSLKLTNFFLLIKVPPSRLGGGGRVVMAPRPALLPDIDVRSFSFRGRFTLGGVSNSHCFPQNIHYPFDQFKVALTYNEAHFRFLFFFFCLATNFCRWRIIYWRHMHFTLLNEICNLKVRWNRLLARNSNKRNSKWESDKKLWK